MRIGIDLGGTKIEGIALNDDGTELLRYRIDCPRHSYQDTIEAIASIVNHLEQSTQKKGTVGIGIPGAISTQTGLVKNANSVWLNGMPLKSDIESRLNRKVRIENDANCLVVSEAVDGSAQGYGLVFGVIVGTGCGGGLFVRGQSIIGLNAIAGEWGHNPLPWPKPSELPGPECYCGKNGCIETWLSGTGFARDHHDHTNDLITAKEIANLIEQEDPKAIQSIERYEDRMARSLASLINIFDPDAIVLGGGMSNISRIYHTVPKLWQKYAFSDKIDTRLLPPKYGDSSGVRGAAWLWNNH